MRSRTIGVLVAVVLVASVAPISVVSADQDERRAELKIYQPHYVDSGVSTEDDGNVTVYETRGRVLEIMPENFNATDVAGVSISEGDATISYDRDRGVYVFDSAGVDGTFRVTWTVNEQVTRNVVDGNTTRTVNETVTREYAAIVATDDVDLAHVPTDRVDQLRQDSENWSEVASLYGSVGNPNKPVEQKLQFGARLVDAAYNPIAALSGDFGLAIQAVFFSAGGLIFFILWNIPHLVRSRRLRRENKELKEKIGDYEDIGDALDEIFTEKRKRYLKEKSWNEWFDDRTASWLRRKFAPEPWSGFRRIMSMLSPGHLNGIVAGAMLDSGGHDLVVEYDRDAVATDGGPTDDDQDVDVLGARMVVAGDVDSDDLEDHEAVIDTSDRLTTAIAAQIDTSTLESDVLRRSDVELRSVALPVGNTPDGDDFVDELNVSIPDDFESREHFADVLDTIVTKVAASDFSSAEGEIEPERDLANLLMGFASIGGEAYNQPYLRYIRDLMLHNLERLDASKRTVDAVEEARDLKEQGGDS